ncbi:Patatin-like phospholipase [Owenweeksia hongkongensis DSM 17368]|uniref:Patatin-like phospholipase n=1 Tax=Owenweeksia hongkongensis (strain DSM 17368 / CIP 108786 / JCM 12287 / NRRL B-23963 / UST20020801) TaxID=926562 RepID=G8R7D3_OWEHD|nr:patatin-like phospholipase family protein [Owenweeksia hongkongensis]AEV31244.1 Patatin-like phospholipase [Owenweeksia hongkongensis DSM 17368]
MISSLLNWIKDRWFFANSFFPIQLFLLHLRRSHLLIIFWLILFAFIGGFMAESYGLSYLFLTPEYLDKVNFVSYFIVGVSGGLFVMAFHISSYIYYSYRYPFLATLSRPLWKFSINNSVIPVLFIGFYLYQVIDLLLREGFDWMSIAINTLGLAAGGLFTILFSFSYFISTLKTLDIPEDGSKKAKALKPLQNIMMPATKIGSRSKTHINYYMSGMFKIKLTRHAGHYGKKVLLETIQQHHFSASIYFVILILLVIGLSLVGDNEVFIIPAGASVFLIFSLYLMVTGAFYTRLKTWTVTIGVVVLFALNYFSGFERFASLNYAYGMNYETERADYSYANFEALTNDSLVKYDKKQSLQILQNWKAKQDESKPKLILLNVSGGGLRSALWVTKVIQEIDKATGNQFYPNIHLITGSSGGMLGAAFLREVEYRNRKGNLDVNLQNDTLLTLMGKDLLNPVTFTLAVNDLFFRLKKVEYEPYSYPKDRGYTFDRRLNENTMGLLDRKFYEYKELEFNSQMPQMVLAPTIVGDGRKLLMSPQGVSYLTFTRPYAGIGREKEHSGIEFSRLFADQDADNLSFLTALRMSASFPYITPLINMPSKPGIELIDAGVRDNEGFEHSLRYVFSHKKWIEENTSGVIIVQIKANRANEIPIEEERVTKLDKLTLPIGGVMKSFHNLQIYNKSLLMELSREELKMPMDIVRFSLINEDKDVSLSWHLTNVEKQSILSTFQNKTNQEALKVLLDALKESR